MIQKKKSKFDEIKCANQKQKVFIVVSEIFLWKRLTMKIECFIIILVSLSYKQINLGGHIHELFSKYQ